MSNFFNTAVPLSELAKILQLEVDHSIKDIHINAVSDSNAPVNNSICDYIKGPLPEQIDNLILLTKDNIDGYTCILVDNPQESIVKVINHIESTIGFHQKYANSQIPASVKIGKNVVIEDNVEIGENTIIEHNVVIHSGTKIGQNCFIRTHSSIGGDGFGFFRDGQNKLVKQPHLGGVTIGDNVEIGSNTCVVRGIVNDTTIGNHTKVDNLVHIAHDCQIGEENFITACAELSGYVTIGNKTSIAPNTCIKQRTNLGDNIIVGMGAVILKDVEDKAVMIGNPAKPLRKFSQK